MILRGDCVEVMAGMDAGSVDAIVTDPPYGLGFMGKKWDALPPGQDWAEECLRVLKPGGHLLAFGGSRTYHRLAVAVEDAGFEIRDQIMWLYGSGFPKSLDVSKAIDKAAGAEREVVGFSQQQQQQRTPAIGTSSYGDYRGQTGDITAPATPEAVKWSGWGTALKPAHEPVVVARKPLIGTVAQNVERFGVGGLNIDGCRVGYEPADQKAREQRTGNHAGEAYGHNGSVRISGGEVAPVNPSGRWPANTVLDEDAAAILDEQSGTLKSPAPYTKSQAGFRTAYVGGETKTPELQSREFGDSGGASRFFYVAKASRKERNAGLEGFEKRRSVDDDWVSESRKDSPGGGRPTPQSNHHPTVKPINLMRWLVRMVTPPGGTVLDPFTGSGTTGCAAALEGFDFIGIEREPDYADIAEARIKHWTPDQLEFEEAAA